jgi:hypothetical protein
MLGRCHRDPSLFCRLLLHSAATLVPGAERAEWLAEWNAEIWYLLHDKRAWPGSPQGGRSSAIRFCLGSFRDAFWLRWNETEATRTERLWLRSPIVCVVMFCILAVSTCCAAVFECALQPPYTGWQFLLGQLLVIGTAALLVRISTPFAFGARPVSDGVPRQAGRFCWWMFLSLKFALVVVIVFFGTLDVKPIIASGRMAPQATLIGYFVGFRWVLRDQARRCPVCLRLLTNPVRIGQPSHVMLDWYGTELICNRGHGLLHIPGTQGSSFSTRRWLRLDSSWHSLFSA